MVAPLESLLPFQLNNQFVLEESKLEEEATASSSLDYVELNDCTEESEEYDLVEVDEPAAVEDSLPRNLTKCIHPESHENKLINRPNSYIDLSMPMIQTMQSLLGESNIELAGKIMDFIISSASKLGEASQSPLFSSTPFGDVSVTDNSPTKAPSETSLSVPLTIDEPTFLSTSGMIDTSSGNNTTLSNSSSAGSLESLKEVFSSLVPSSPEEITSISPSIPTLSPSMTPYTADSIINNNPKRTSDVVMHFLLYDTTLPISRAGAWKAFNLFAVGVANSYGRVLYEQSENMTTNFVTALLVDRYPLSPIAFSSLTLDILSFVNSTQHYNCPPRNAYSPQSLAKLLFLRLSEYPEAYVTISLDYFRVASVNFVHPLILQRKNETDDYQIPMTRLPFGSLGAVMQAAPALSSLLRTSEGSTHLNANDTQVDLSSEHDGRKNTNEDEELHENILIDSYKSQFKLPCTQREALKIIEGYNVNGVYDAFVDFPFKVHDKSLDSVLKAANLSLGPLGLALTERTENEAVQIVFPFEKVLRAATPLPPIANLGGTETVLNPPNNPPMSKMKRLKLERLGLFPSRAPSTAPSLIVV